MCLAIPAEIIQINNDDTALVAVGEVHKTVSLALVEQCQVGDFVLIHVGFALEKLDIEEAERTLALFAELGDTLTEAEPTVGATMGEGQ